MQMKVKSSLMKSAICAGMLLTTFAVAQSPITPTVQDPTTRHHLRQYQLMTQEMSAMTAQMSRGEVTVEQRKQMAQRISLMSNVMRRMSGLEAQSPMKEVELEKADGFDAQANG